MRYRPFGESGGAISNLTLSLGREDIQKGPQAVHALIYAALEAGINSYHLESPDPVLAETVGQALASIERDLVYVALLIDGGGRRALAGWTSSCWMNRARWSCPKGRWRRSRPCVPAGACGASACPAAAM